jgi:hypothetical protein
MKYHIGQKVSFQTRNGNPEGLRGKGVIIDIFYDVLDKYLIKYSYTVKHGPYVGQVITSRVECLETELKSP